MTGLATVLGLPVLILGVVGQEKHRLDGAKFGAKSSYFPVANTDDSPLEVEGCKPVMLWMYVRHGTRNPGDSDIAGMKTLLPPLQEEVLSAWEEGRGDLTSEEVEQLQNWQFDLEFEDASLLVEAGRLENLQMGQRWRNRLADLVSDPSSIEARSSHKSRTIESGNNFLKGLVSDEEPLPPMAVDRNITRYFDYCAKFDLEVEENENVTYAEMYKLEKSQAWANMLRRVSNRSGVDMNSEQAKVAWDMCRYELSWYPEKYKHTFPPWCALFTMDDLELFDFREDLKYYWNDGNAFDITSKMTQPLFKDIFNNIEEQRNGKKDNRSKVILNFSHSEGVQPLMTALGLFRDDRHLLASDWGTDKQEHKWRVSDIATFGSNIGIAVFDCEPNADMKVMLFHNEHLVEEQPACGESVCSLTSFREYYQHLLDLDLREECATTFSAAAGTEEIKDVEEHEEYETDISDEDDDSSQEDSDEDSSEESIEEDN